VAVVEEGVKAFEDEAVEDGEVKEEGEAKALLCRFMRQYFAHFNSHLTEVCLI
jgi:hypothetical protein